MRYAFVCLFLMLLPLKDLLAQQGPGQLLWKAKEIKMTTALQKKGVKFLYQLNLEGIEPQDGLKANKVLPGFSLPVNYYNEQLGWVCRQEWKLEQKVKLPLRFRLGSKEQVDYLEGKHHYHDQ